MSRPTSAVPALIGGLMVIWTVSLGLLSPGFILSIVLLVLRMTGNTGLSWLWVTAGVWGPIGLGIGLTVLYGCLLAAIGLYVSYRNDEDDET